MDAYANFSTAIGMRCLEKPVVLSNPGTSSNGAGARTLGAVASTRRRAGGGEESCLLGERHGVDPGRNVAFDELWDDLSPKDRSARLWPQTERIKGWLTLASLGETEDEIDDAFAKVAKASAGLRLYLETPIRGLWRDKMDEAGHFTEEPAPASSLYHIVCAISEMHAVVP